MMKKLVLFTCFLTFLVASVYPKVNSTKYIYLRSTESAKMKKKPRSVESFPVQAILDVNQLQVFFSKCLSHVNILIFDNLTNEKIVDVATVTQEGSIYIVDLAEYGQGEYTVEFVIPDDILVGDFIIDENPTLMP